MSEHQTKIVNEARSISERWQKDSDHFFSHINFKQSWLDARSIAFMNEYSIMMDNFRRLLSPQPPKEEV